MCQNLQSSGSTSLADLPIEILEQCFSLLRVDPMPRACIDYFSRHSLGSVALLVDTDAAQRRLGLALLCRASKRFYGICVPLLYEFFGPSMALDKMVKPRVTFGTHLTRHRPNSSPLRFVKHWSTDFEAVQLSRHARCDIPDQGWFGQLWSIDLAFSSVHAPEIIAVFFS